MENDELVSWNISWAVRDIVRNMLNGRQPWKNKDEIRGWFQFISYNLLPIYQRRGNTFPHKRLSSLDGDPAFDDVDPQHSLWDS